MPDEPLLPDGRYDAFILDASAGGDDALRLELTIIAGEHKGEVVTVAAVGLDRDELELVGMPATLAVADGEPSVTIDD